MKLNLKFVNKISRSIIYSEIIFINEKKLKNNHLKSLEKSIFSSKLFNELSFLKKDYNNRGYIFVNCINSKLSKTIALASIISKETRDTIMRQLSINYPSYSFDNHFGYGTLKHKNAILENGVLDLHRISFKPIGTIYSKNL